MKVKYSSGKMTFKLNENLDNNTILNERNLLKSSRKSIKENIEESEESKKLKKRIARYRSVAGLDEDVEITEDNLDEWCLRHTCNLENWDYDKARNQLLGRA